MGNFSPARKMITFKSAPPIVPEDVFEWVINNR
jgi:hypothetical protein